VNKVSRLNKNTNKGKQIKKVVKPKPLFNKTHNIEQLFSTFKRRYPKSKLFPDSTNTVDDGSGIDLSKLDIEDQILMVRGQFLPVNVWLVETEEDLERILNYVEKYEHIAYDTETTSLDEAKTVPDVLMWSLAVLPTEGFVIPYKFNKRMFEFITTTTKQIWAHNAGFDNRIVHWNTGKHIVNANCSLLLNWSYLNDTVLTPSLSIKNLVKKDLGIWSEKGSSYDITNLTKDDVGNVDLQYYSGVDPCGVIITITKHLKEFAETEDVVMEDVLPADLPKERSYSRMWFYKNISRKLLPITIEFMNNGLPLDLNQVHKLDTHLDDILDKAENGVRELKTVQTYWENLRGNKASEASAKYEETVDLDNVKIYKSTNQDYVNMFVETMYNKILPSKAKNWSATVVKTFDTTLAEAIKNKDLESLRFVEKYSTYFTVVEDILTKRAKFKKEQKSEETSKNKASKVMLDFEFKPLASAQQKKYILQKGFGVTSNTKSMTTGEDSFNRAELERLVREVQEGTELYSYLTHLITFSGAAIIKKNFVKNFLAHSTEDSNIHGNVRLCATKSFRLGGGGKINLLNTPSSRSPWAKQFKKCIRAPKGWVWLASDYSFLEVSASASITRDVTLVKTLAEGYDAHCMNSAKYNKDEVEAILGTNDGTIEWNKRYKTATETNPTLDKIRSNSKSITFALTYMAGIPGLYKAVGYLGDTHDGIVKINTDTYKFTLDIQDNGGYFIAKKDATWYDILDYKGVIPQNLEGFFEIAVVPARNMHYVYHNELYSGLKNYREQTIIPQVRKHKNFHMGLGAYINQTKRLNNGSIRTLNNVSNQFFSLLPLIALTSFMKEAEKMGYKDDIKPIISIYDSVYILVRNDHKIIDWVAETLQPILEKQYLKDQPIKLESDIEVSLTDWASLISYAKYKENR
jgi:DNA polymerase I-like protein with 3'-5' exonuclease and polymerase domains